MVPCWWFVCADWCRASATNKSAIKAIFYQPSRDASGLGDTPFLNNVGWKIEFVDVIIIRYSRPLNCCEFDNPWIYPWKYTQLPLHSCVFRDFVTIFLVARKTCFLEFSFLFAMNVCFLRTLFVFANITFRGWTCVCFQTNSSKWPFDHPTGGHFSPPLTMSLPEEPGIQFLFGDVYTWSCVQCSTIATWRIP